MDAKVYRVWEKISMGIMTIFNSLFRRKYKPEYFVQLSSNNLNIMGHKLFSLSNVHPYIWVPMEYPRNPPGFNPVPEDGTPRSYAVNAANWIEYNRNLLRAAWPKKTFKYAFWPAGYFHKNPYVAKNNALASHEDDKINHNGGKYDGPWHAAGIRDKAAFMDVFYKEFAAELKLRSLPKPLFVDPDDEQVYANCHFTGDRSADYQILASDPRFSTEKIDGILTLSEFFAQHTLADGTPSPITGSIPHIYDTSNPNSAYWQCSLNMRIRDWVIHETNNKFVRKYLGTSVDCQNWCQFASSREHPSYIVRFKESALDYNGPAFRQTCQVWSIYGFDWVDSKWLDGTGGYKTFNNCLSKFKVSIDGTESEKIEQVYLGEIEFNLNACRNASSKPLVLWLQWMPTKDYSPEQVPPEGGTFSMTNDTMIDVLNIAKNNQVARIGLFEPTLTSTQADAYHKLLTTTIYI
jgi:hypothetical protein